MRAWIARIVRNPWVYRVTCLAIFLPTMIVVQHGLRRLKTEPDTMTGLEIGLPVLAAIFLFGWLLQRAGVGRE